jgi:hypothetical protein
VSLAAVGCARTRIGIAAETSVALEINFR